MSWRGIIERYRDHLPVSESTPVVTLLEGNTPLVPAPVLARRLGLNGALYLKVEGQNPTGSFKDRGMTVAVSKALEARAQAVICASTGNTSASAAAFAARCGLRCVVLIPDGAVALGKLAQALGHGAQVLAVRGNFDQALGLVRQLAQRHPIALVNSVNPHRLEGQKTAAFEICDELGGAPGFLALPVGNGGNITAYWQGFREYQRAGKTSSLPRLLGFQAAGAAPLVEGRPITHPRTVASAIRIGNPASWQGAVRAKEESGGLIDKVTDEEILAAYRLVAEVEGIFCEPASAASLAGVGRLARAGFFPPGAEVVAVLTGHGLKDPAQAVESSQRPRVVPADLAQLEALLCEAPVASQDAMAAPLPREGPG